MTVKELIRPNILKLEPYRCARDDYKVGILLDANENTHGVALSGLSDQEKKLELFRYPDPHQIDNKQLMCDWRNQEAKAAGLPASLTPENLYMSVGSDEAIDSLQRVMCTPGKDKLLVCPPTYGMYGVSANINDVEVVKCYLDAEFDLDTDKIIETLKDPTIKLLYACSPGNPTGKLLSLDRIKRIINEWQGGILVVDEAYIDFSGPSLASLVTELDRLVVLQTFSKSFGLAGVRCGMCFAHKDLAVVLNSMKAPYNISSTTSELVHRALAPESISLMKENVQKIKIQRARLAAELPQIPGLGNVVGGLDANFLLVQVLDKPGGSPSNDRAQQVYQQLAEDKQIVVRFRGKEPGCFGCLRISVGTPEENDELKAAIAQIV